MTPLNIRILSALIAGVALVGNAESAVLSTQDLYIANQYQSNSISIIYSGTQTSQLLYSNVISGVPFSIGFANGDLFVGNGGNDTLAVLPKNQNSFQNITPPGMWFPCGIATDQNGDIFVASHNNGVITKISGKDYSSSFFCDAGWSSSGIAFDSRGNLYVANLWGNAIYKIDSGTTTANLFCNSGINNPWQIAFDLNDNMFIANGGGNYISMIRNGNNYADVYCINGTSSIAGIAIDNSNNIYFSQSNNIYQIAQGSTNAVLFANTGDYIPYQLAFNPIPEPSTYALFGISAIGMLVVLRGKRTA